MACHSVRLYQIVWPESAGLTRRARMLSSSTHASSVGVLLLGLLGYHDLGADVSQGSIHCVPAGCGLWQAEPDSEHQDEIAVGLHFACVAAGLVLQMLVSRIVRSRPQTRMTTESSCQTEPPYQTEPPEHQSEPRANEHAGVLTQGIEHASEPDSATSGVTDSSEAEHQVVHTGPIRLWDEMPNPLPPTILMRCTSPVHVVATPVFRDRSWSSSKIPSTAPAEILSIASAADQGSHRRLPLLTRAASFPKHAATQVVRKLSFTRSAKSIASAKRKARHRAFDDALRPCVDGDAVGPIYADDNALEVLPPLWTSDATSSPPSED